MGGLLMGQFFQGLGDLEEADFQGLVFHIKPV
jgi:hypothetical protein